MKCKVLRDDNRSPLNTNRNRWDKKTSNYKFKDSSADEDTDALEEFIFVARTRIGKHPALFIPGQDAYYGNA
jgi:hypothetical protein